MKFQNQLKQQLGSIFLQERLKRRFHLNYVSQKTNISVSMLELIEFGNDNITWKIYQRLLHFYNKDIEIKLIDRL